MNPLQGLYLALHHRLFRYRQARRIEFPESYVVSVGNLSVGGTGKTPAVELLARHALRRHPLIVLRGYGGSRKESELLVCDGERILSDWRRAGDEAILLAERTRCRVAVGRDRTNVIRKFGRGCGVVLLDDAFQNPLVHRDHDLVLIDASIDLKSMRLFPCGQFREPLEALERADSVLLTRCDQIGPEGLDRLKELVGRFLPPDRIFEAEHRPEKIEPELPAGFRGPLGAFCGLGNGRAFFRTLEGCGLVLEERLQFPDHHPYGRGDLARLIAPFRNADFRWITTAKDMVRLRGRPDLPEELKSRLHVLSVGLEIRGKRERRFLNTVFREVRPVRNG